MDTYRYVVYDCKGIYFILNIYTGHRQNVIDHWLSPFTCKIEHEIVQIYLSLNSIKIASNIQSKNIYQAVQKYRLLLYKQLGRQAVKLYLFSP